MQILDDVFAYREGIVTKNEFNGCSCCHLNIEEEEIFHYLELKKNNGESVFVYEDTEGFSRFEQNFHQNRFTSYHEFWTTKEIAKEERSGLTFIYYVRLTEDYYKKMPLQEVRKLLQENAFPREEDRITAWGKYDRKAPQ